MYSFWVASDKPAKVMSSIIRFRCTLTLLVLALFKVLGICVMGCSSLADRTIPANSKHYLRPPICASIPTDLGEAVRSTRSLHHHQKSISRNDFNHNQALTRNHPHELISHQHIVFFSMI
jgi:hypothetical protein